MKKSPWLISFQKSEKARPFCLSDEIREIFVGLKAIVIWTVFAIILFFVCFRVVWFFSVLCAGDLPQFQKMTTELADTHNVPYDYSSIMHYGETYFSKNNKPTIVTRDPKYQKLIGQREMISFNDAKGMNAMYSCGSKCRFSENSLAHFREFQSRLSRRISSWVLVKFGLWTVVIEESCSNKNSCPANSFIGQDCQCYCASSNKQEVVKVCGGSSVTTTAPRTTARASTTKKRKSTIIITHCTIFLQTFYFDSFYSV